MSDSGVLNGHCREHNRDREWCVDCLRDEVSRLRSACIAQQHEIQQILGVALRYPRFCDDAKNFPDATAADGVCVGANIAESLAYEAAEKIATMREALRPFAEQAGIIDAQRQDGGRWDDAAWFRFGTSVTAVTLGDCRRARDVR